LDNLGMLLRSKRPEALPQKHPYGPSVAPMGAVIGFPKTALARACQRWPAAVVGLGPSARTKAALATAN